MAPILSLTVLLVVFAFAELVAKKTKAVLSTTLVMSTVMLILFWLGLPGDILQTSATMDIGMVLVGIVITSLGTSIDFKELKRQWKTVLMGLTAVVVAVAGILVLGGLVMAPNLAYAGAPIFAGANAATLIMITALKEKGLEIYGSFCVLVLVSQSFIGIPIASFFLKKEAKRFLALPGAVSEYLSGEEEASADGKKRRKPLEIPWLNSPSAMLAKLGLVSTVSFYLSQLTNGKVHYFVFVLILGIIFAETGFLETNILEKTGSSTLLIFLTTVVMFGSLADTTPKMLLDMIVPLIIVLAIGVLAVILVSFLLSRVLKIGFGLAVAIGLSCTFGFPATMFMSNEVSEAVGRTPEEKKALKNYLLPKMLTAGFVTVTIASVFCAGIVAGLL